MKEKYLPIGTVVTLQKATKRIMIIGYCPISEDKTMYDYSACLYPEGVISQDKTLVFNHEQIAQIHYTGLEDEEEKDFILKMKNAVANMSELKNIKLPEEGTSSNNGAKVEETLSIDEKEEKKEVSQVNTNVQTINSIDDIMNN